MDHISGSRPPTINPEPQLKPDHSVGLFVKDSSFRKVFHLQKKTLFELAEVEESESKLSLEKNAEYTPSLFQMSPSN